MTPIAHALLWMADISPAAARRWDHDLGFAEGTVWDALCESPLWKRDNLGGIRCEGNYDYDAAQRVGDNARKHPLGRASIVGGRVRVSGDGHRKHHRWLVNFTRRRIREYGAAGVRLAA